jgi:hypothetical protein
MSISWRIPARPATDLPKPESGARRTLVRRRVRFFHGRCRNREFTRQAMPDLARMKSGHHRLANRPSASGVLRRTPQQTHPHEGAR